MALTIDFRDGDALVWRVDGEGATHRRDADWTPTLFVHGPDRPELETVRGHLARLPSVAATAIERHRPGFRHDAVLRFGSEHPGPQTEPGDFETGGTESGVLHGPPFRRSRGKTW